MADAGFSGSDEDGIKIGADGNDGQMVGWRPLALWSRSDHMHPTFIAYRTHEVGP